MVYVLFLFCSSAICSDNSGSNGPVQNEKIKIIMQNGSILTGSFVGYKGDKIFLESSGEEALVIKKSDIITAYDADTAKEIIFASLSSPTPTETKSVIPTETADIVAAETATPASVPVKTKATPAKTPEHLLPAPVPAPYTPQFHFGIEGGATNLEMTSCNNWLKDTLTAWNEVAGITGSIKPVTLGFYCALNLDYSFLSWLALCGRFEYVSSMQDEGRAPSPMSSIIASLYPAMIGICLEPRIAQLTLKAGYFAGYGYANLLFLNGNGTASAGALVNEFIAGFSIGPVGLNFGYRLCNVSQLSYQGAPIVDELTGNIVSFDYSGAFGGLVLTF